MLSIEYNMMRVEIRLDEPPQIVRRMYHRFKAVNFRYGIVRWNNPYVLNDWIRNRGYNTKKSPYRRLCGTKDFFLAYGSVVMWVRTEWLPMKYLVTGNVYWADRDKLVPTEFEMYSVRPVSLSDIERIEYYHIYDGIVYDFLSKAEELGYSIPAKPLKYSLSEVRDGIINRAILYFITEFEIPALLPREVVLYVNGKSVNLLNSNRPIHIFIGWLWNEDHGLPTPDRIHARYDLVMPNQSLSDAAIRLTTRLEYILRMFLSKEPKISQERAIISKVVDQSMAYIHEVIPEWEKEEQHLLSR